MNEFEAWQEILEEWKEVNRMKKLHQELDDLLGGALMFTMSYAKKNHIPIPDMKNMVGRVHEIMGELNAPTTENQQRNKTTGDSTLQ